MKTELNPFPSIGYYDKEYFCDRETELSVLSRNAENGTNTTLISVRRLGKSSLIYRLFDELKEKTERICIYTDMYASQNLKDFTEILALSILREFPEKKSLGKRFLEFLKGFRPIITYDVLSGKPEVHFEFVQPKECEQTLRGILIFLEQQKIPILLAIDEFQQVANYPEKNTEALLRTIIQTLKNVQFIFSGSNKHLMNEIFNSAKRPFFSSTQILGLSAIPQEKYKPFISQKFSERKRTITEESVDFILEWTRSHTYYTQTICKNTFDTKTKQIDLTAVKHVCDELLISQQSTYIQYRNLLSPLQWKLLIAIAKEEKLYSPQANIFLQKHQLGAASSVKKSLDALLDKEMIYSTEEVGTVYYQVYDVFLLRWLQRTF